MNKITKITVTVNGVPVTATAGMTLSEIVGREKPCGGHGRCGKCRVLTDGRLSPPSEQEKRLISEHDLARGVRLACLARALGDCKVEYQGDADRTQIVVGGTAVHFAQQPTFRRYGAAVDIGTTTLAARLYDAKGALLAEVSRLNPQISCGADVVSRIEAALAGKAEQLALLIRQALNEMLDEMVLHAGIDANEIERVAVTGNTVMLSLLVGESVEPFSHAPFEARRLFDEEIPAHALSLTSMAPTATIYLPRCISAFVGADIACALVATRLCESGTAMLIDIGTNGEMALWHGGRLTVCSTAAGPAFEGVGISCGMRGAVGAIDRVTVANGTLHAHTIGGGKPKGICGSGLCDAVACLLDLELLDESGYLEDGSVVLDGAVTLTQKDIRMLQLAKSAIGAGLLTLVSHTGLTPHDIPVLHIAGGFGHYLNVHSATRIGLLPSALSGAARAVGNAALDGAAMLLLDGDSRMRLCSVVQTAEVLALSTNADFTQRYMEGMTF